MIIKTFGILIFGYNGVMSEALRLWLSNELNRRSWSHNELARQTGFSQTFVSNVLKGDRKPSVNFCNRVAEALEVSPDMLMRLAGLLPPAEPASPADESIIQELVELARNLPVAQQRQLLEYTRFLHQTNRPDEG